MKPHEEDYLLSVEDECESCSDCEIDFESLCATLPDEDEANT